MLQNLNLDWCALDEIGCCAEDTWKMLQARLRKAGGSHHGFGVGNPAGPTHWTYQSFVALARNHPDQYRLVQAPSGENTYNPTTYVELLTTSFRKGSTYYRRYVLGEFVSFEGAYWPTFNSEYWPNGHKLHVEDVLKVVTPLYWGRVVDFGFGNPFACLWWVTDGHRIVFLDEHYQSHESILNHMLQVREKEQYHQTLWGQHTQSISYTDHDGQACHEIETCKDIEQKEIGFPCTKAEKKVMEGILLVQTLFTKGQIYITDLCEHSLIEVPSYRSKRSRTGIVPAKEQPLKESDHTCDCIRMVCWEIFSRGSLFNVPIPDDVGYTMTQKSIEELGPDDIGSYDGIPEAIGAESFAV